MWLGILIATALVVAPIPAHAADRVDIVDVALAGALDAVDAAICGRPLGLERPGESAGAFDARAVDPAAPWMAKLEIVEDLAEGGESAIWSCGAAVLSRDWIATAAHCVRFDRPASIRVTLGARDVLAAEAIRRVGAVAICHRDYDPDGLRRDFALVRLSEPLPPGFPTLRVASAAEAQRLRPGTDALSAGWARVSEQSVSRRLRRARVEIVNPARAEDGLIEAAPTLNEQSLCLGESGAPLVADGGFGPALVGVFSSVDAVVDPETGRMVELCDGFEARSYFTPVYGLEQWIDDATGLCERDLVACLAHFRR